MASSTSSLSTSPSSFSSLSPSSGISANPSESPKISSSAASLAELQEIITQMDREASLNEELEKNRASSTQAFVSASEAKSNPSTNKAAKQRSKISPKPYFD